MGNQLAGSCRKGCGYLKPIRLDGGQVRLREGQLEGELQLNSLNPVVIEASVHRGGRPLVGLVPEFLRRPPRRWGLRWALQLFRPLGRG